MDIIHNTRYIGPMFGFTFKKSFFNFWDNLYKIILLNVGYILIIGLSLLAVAALLALPIKIEMVKIALYLLIPFIFIFIYLGGVHGFVREIIDYKKPGIKTFFKYLKENFIISLIFALLNTTLVFLISIAVNFYMANDEFILSVPAMVFLFWAVVLWLGASQFFFPIIMGLDRNLFKALKKMLLIFLDNPLFSLGIFFLSIITTIISVLTLFMLPGFAFVPLLQNAALKLRLFKYDYMEENPEEDHKNIPWDMLLKEEREKIGKRSLKGFIFPWKE